MVFKFLTILLTLITLSTITGCGGSSGSSGDNNASNNVNTFEGLSGSFDITEGEFNSFEESRVLPAWFMFKKEMNDCIDNAHINNPRFYLSNHFMVYGEAGVTDEDLQLTATFAEEALSIITDKLDVDPDSLRDDWPYRYDPALRISMQLLWAGIDVDGQTIDMVSIKGEENIPTNILEALSHQQNVLSDDSSEALQSLLYRYWFDLSANERRGAFNEAIDFIENLGISLQHEAFDGLPLQPLIHWVLDNDNEHSIISYVGRFTENIQICVKQPPDDFVGVKGSVYWSGILIHQPTVVSETIKANNYQRFRAIMVHEMVHEVFHNIAVDDYYGGIVDYWFVEGLADFLSNNKPAAGGLDELNVLKMKTSEEVEDSAKLYDLTKYDLYPYFNLAVSHLFTPNAQGGMGNDILVIKDIAFHMRNNPSKTGMSTYYEARKDGSGTKGKRLFDEAFNAVIKDSDGINPLTLQQYEAEYFDRIPL